MSELQLEKEAASPPTVASSKSQKARHYLYAVVPLAAARALGPVGLGGAEVFAVSEGALAILTSRTGAERLRPERRNLAAHHGVLKQLNEEGAVLPMAFGTIASSEQAVRDILTRHQELFLAQLRKVTGKVEMGLRVVWDVPNVFEYIVNRHPELKSARDQMLVDGQNRDDMIQLGRLFEQVLSSEKDRLYARVAGVLQRSGAAVKRNPVRSEKEVMNLACLIPKEQQGEFEAIACEAAKGFDSNYLFDLSGPWSPYNFIELALQL